MSWFNKKSKEETINERINELLSQLPRMKSEVEGVIAKKIMAVHDHLSQLGSLEPDEQQMARIKSGKALLLRSLEEERARISKFIDGVHEDMRSFLHKETSISIVEVITKLHSDMDQVGLMSGEQPLEAMILMSEIGIECMKRELSQRTARNK